MNNILQTLHIAALLPLLVGAAGLLWASSRRSPGRLWLGCLLACNAVLVLGIIAMENGVISTVDFPLLGATFFGLFAASPLCLYKAVASVAEPKPVSARDILAFLPVPAVSIALLISRPAGLIALHAVAVAAFILAARPLRTSPSWMRALFAVFVLHWACSGLSTLFGQMEWQGGSMLEAASLATLLLFALGAGFSGVRNLGAGLPTVRTFREASAKQSINPESARLCERLRDLFETEAIHLDPDLTLERLAVRAGAEPREVSRVLNTVLGGGYHDVVRRYRIEHAQKLLLDRREDSITEIFHEAGFNSKSAFHRAFNAQVGMSPSTYRRMYDSGRPTS